MRQQLQPSANTPSRLQRPPEAAIAWAARQTAPPSPLVVQDSVGPYDYAVLKADNKDLMVQWLNDNHYFIPPATLDAAAPICIPGAYFLALKLKRAGGGRPAAGGAALPVRSADDSDHADLGGGAAQHGRPGVDARRGPRDSRATTITRSSTTRRSTGSTPARTTTTSSSRPSARPTASTPSSPSTRARAPSCRTCSTSPAASAIRRCSPR